MITLPFEQYHAMRERLYFNVAHHPPNTIENAWDYADQALHFGGYVCGPEPVGADGNLRTPEAQEAALAAARKEERERVLMFLETFAMDCYEERSEANDFVDAFRAALEKEDT